MTERECQVRDYFANKAEFSCRWTNEAELLSRCKEALNMLGAVWFRGPADLHAGISDLIICYNGRYVAVECKTSSGPASAQQIKFIKAVNKNGGYAAIVRSISDMFSLLTSTR